MANNLCDKTKEINLLIKKYQEKRNGTTPTEESDKILKEISTNFIKTVCEYQELVEFGNAKDFVLINCFDSIVNDIYMMIRDMQNNFSENFSETEKNLVKESKYLNKCYRKFYDKIDYNGYFILWKMENKFENDSDQIILEASPTGNMFGIALKGFLNCLKPERECTELEKIVIFPILKEYTKKK